MKRFMRAAVTTAVIALVLPSFAWARTKEPGSKQTPPKVTALVCSFNPGEPLWSAPHVYVVGGCIAGNGWIEGGKATGLLHKGDRLSLHALETGSLGQVVLTSSDGGQGGYGGIAVLVFPVKVSIPPQKEAAYAKARTHRPMLAAWNPEGRAPRFITGRTLDKNSSAYRKVIADWLRRRGIADDVISKVVIEQIVSADINRDGQDETFLSFYTPHVVPKAAFKPPSERNFSYLIMRYRLPRSRDLKTVVVQYDTLVHDVAGFCDLDGEGWAEMVTGSDAGESGGDDLHHWVGDRFETFKGWRAGV